MRAAQRARAMTMLALGAACGGTSDGPHLSPGDLRASLAVGAVVQATTATAIELRAGYLRASGERVELAATTVPLSASTSDQATVAIDLARCLADAQRAVTGAACAVALELRLLRNATVLDRQTVTVSVRPGDAAVVAAPVPLYEVARVGIGTAGVPTTTAVRVEVSDTVRLRATAFDATDAALPNRTVQWESASPATARVDASTGLVTGMASGATVVRALGARVPAEVTVTVAPASVRSLVASPSALQLAPGDTRALVVTARDASGNVLTGRAIGFTSSNAAVAAVGADGVVRAVAAGTATVTAVSSDGPNGSTIRVDVPVVVAVSGPTAIVSGRLVVGGTGAAVAGATLVFATPSGVIAATVTSAADGTWRTPAIPQTTYTASIAAAGLRSTTIRVLPVGGDVSVPTIPMTPGTVTGGVVQLTLRDAATGQLLPVPATLTVVDGVVLSSSAVDAVGGSIVSAPAGGVATLSVPNTVTIRVRAAGYGDALQYAAPAGQAVPLNIALVPTAGATGQVRIVLTWGANPADLDSYLAGPTSAGGRFHVGYLYDDAGSCLTSPFACLDVDETEGFGPETITIQRQLPGVYRYVVNRFYGAGTIATSDARVDVYVSGQLAAVFTPPPGNGDWWNVFELSNGQIIRLNTYGTGLPSVVAARTAPTTTKRSAPFTARRP